MADIDTKQLRRDVDGFQGRFFYDGERGDIGYIAKACDDKQCDCEEKLNSDGDQDCSRSLDDWQGEDHLCEPIARMLNAVGPLLDRIDALESGHVWAVEAQLADVAETLGKERLEAADGYHGTAVRALVDRIDALEAEKRRAQEAAGELHGMFKESREQLAAAAAARDEACDIADALSNYIAVGNPYAKVAERQARIAQLRTAGTKEQT